MVVLKEMELQTDCQKCPFMATDGADKLSPMMCIALWATKHEVKHCTQGKILDDCPLVEIEERKVGKWIDKEKIMFPICSKCGLTSVEKYSFCPNCGTKMDEEVEEKKE